MLLQQSIRSHITCRNIHRVFTVFLQNIYVRFCFSEDLLFVFIFFDKSLTFWQIWWTTQKSSQLLRPPQRRLPGCTGPGPGMQDFTHFPSKPDTEETAITSLRISSGQQEAASWPRLTRGAQAGEAEQRGCGEHSDTGHRAVNTAPLHHGHAQVPALQSLYIKRI